MLDLGAYFACMLTLWAAAWLGVAAPWCGGFGVRGTLGHGVQVTLFVRADHFALSWAGATAPGALVGNRERSSLKLYRLLESKHFMCQEKMTTRNSQETYTSLCLCLLCVFIWAYQSPHSDLPVNLHRAGGHLTGLDRGRAEQSAAQCVLQPHASCIHTGDLSGLFTWTTGHWTLQTKTDFLTLSWMFKKEDIISVKY